MSITNWWNEQEEDHEVIPVPSHVNRLWANLFDWGGFFLAMVIGIAIGNSATNGLTSLIGLLVAPAYFVLNFVVMPRMTRTTIGGKMSGTRIHWPVTPVEGNELWFVQPSAPRLFARALIQSMGMFVPLFWLIPFFSFRHANLADLVCNTMVLGANHVTERSLYDTTNIAVRPASFERVHFRK